MPWQNVENVVLWEGTIGCIIDHIITSSVETTSVMWKKDGEMLREESVKDRITFGEVNTKDEGVYVVTFDARSHETSPLKPFEFNLTVEVNCKSI